MSCTRIRLTLALFAAVLCSTAGALEIGLDYETLGGTRFSGKLWVEGTVGLGDDIFAITKVAGTRTTLGGVAAVPDENAPPAELEDTYEELIVNAPMSFGYNNRFNKGQPSYFDDFGALFSVAGVYNGFVNLWSSRTPSGNHSYFESTFDSQSNDFIKDEIKSMSFRSSDLSFASDYSSSSVPDGGMTLQLLLISFLSLAAANLRSRLA